MPTRSKIMIAFVLLSPMSATVLHADEPVELTITPRAVEQPLLKYRMFPAEFELKDGNAAPVLLRMIWDQQPYMTQVYGTYDRYLELSLDDPELIENGTVHFEGKYEQLKRAAFLRSADWEYPIEDEPAAFVGLSDVQGARQFVGNALSIWIRYHIAQGELKNAREGIGVGLAVSRHYARTPFVITQLVCQAIDGMMLDRVEELIGQSDGPNLYWALTALPAPLHDARPCIEFEERMYELSLIGLPEQDYQGAGDPSALRKIRKDELDHLDDPRSQDEWEALYWATFYLNADVVSVGTEPVDRAEPDEIRQRIVDKARTELPNELPGGADRVEQMSDAEVAVRWFAKRHRALSQEITALMSLPPQQALPALKELQAKIKDFREENGLRTLFNLENPLKLYVVLRRNERRIAMLRVIEGLRHYAATHDGELPAALADLKETPAPEDPLLEQPFEYKVEDGVATLSAPGIDVGDAKLAEYTYRINVRKP